MNISKALVTGGTSGIGLAICEQLVSRGIQVYSVSRNPEKFQSREKYHLLKLDLSDLNAIPEFGNDFVKKFGVPDLIINNAGYGAFFEWKDFPHVEIGKQINTLFTAPLLLCRSFAPIMEDRGSGTIVNITSLATLFPLPYMPIYNAGKSALSSFTQSMELESRTIKWIDFRLGDVKTNFNKSAPRQNIEVQTESMKSAWVQIEKQLDESPEPVVVAEQILKKVYRRKSGRFYGGGFFQARIAPILGSLFFNSIIQKILNIRYSLKI